jgi:signal transduction histidine kinase
VGNAIKYGKDGGRVRVIQEQKGELLEITVWDDGIGISHENLSAIFEPYFRVQGTGKPGTGLGLYIVKQLVEKMSGSVRCESEYGKWTAFTFTLPLA